MQEYIKKWDTVKPMDDTIYKLIKHFEKEETDLEDNLCIKIKHQNTDN